MTDEAAVAILVRTGASYLFGCYLLYRVGKKFGIGSFGAYCVPIYNLILICRCKSHDYPSSCTSNMFSLSLR